VTAYDSLDLAARALSKKPRLVGATPRTLHGRSLAAFYYVVRNLVDAEERQSERSDAIDLAGAGAHRSHGLLLGFLTKAEVDALFSQNPVRFDGDGTLAAAHERARLARNALQPHSPGVTAPLPADIRRLAAEIQQTAVYKKEYEAKADYEFVSVPIAALVTPQMNVDWEYVRQLAHRLPARPNGASDFAFAFPTANITEPIIKGNTVVFTSHAPNIAVAPVPIVRRTAQGFDVVFEAKSRPNFVMVARLAGKLVLHNGVHKVLALRLRGRTQTFAVAYEVQHQAQLGLPQANLSMFAEVNYSTHVRPPLVVDFDGPTAVPVSMRSTMNVYRLVGQTEEIIAPALSI